MCQMKEKRPQSLDIIPIPVTPAKPRASAGFKEWLRRAFRLPNSQTSAEAVNEYARTAYDAGLERLRTGAVRNEHLEAQIEQALADARLKDNQAYKESKLTGAQEDLTRAQARKTNAEADAIQVESVLKLCKEFREQGIEVTLILKDGRLYGISVVGHVSKVFEAQDALIAIPDKPSADQQPIASKTRE